MVEDTHYHPQAAGTESPNHRGRFRRTRDRRWVVIAVTATLLVVSAIALWATSRGPERGVAPQLAVRDITMAQQVAFGQRAAPFLAAEHGGLVADMGLQRHVTYIGERLVAHNRLESTGNQFRFALLADDRVTACYGLPGGKIYMTHAAYLRLDSDGEIAAVLAHSMAHLVQGHFLQNLHQREALPGIPATAILAEVDPKRPSSLHTDRIRRLIETALRMEYTPAQNEIADQQMLVYLTRSGYHPDSLVSAWEKMLAPDTAIRPVMYDETQSGRMQHLRQRIQEAFPYGAPNSWIR